MLKRLLIISALALLFALPSNAQRRRKVPVILQGLYAGGKVGPNLFFGDLVDDGKTKIGTDVFALYEVQPYLMARAGIGGGVLGGVQGSKSNGLKFTTPYFNFNVGADFTFLNLLQFHNPSRIVDPYVGLGAGVLMFSATKEDTKGRVSDTEYGDWRNVKTGFKAAPFIYGIIGGRYFINRHWSAILEIQANMPFSDDLDGHTGWASKKTDEEMDQERNDIQDRIDQEINDAANEGVTINPGEVPQPNEYKWHSGKNDFFYTIMAGATYKFEDKTWKNKSRYNRSVYLHNKKVYKRNASRKRRR